MFENIFNSKVEQVSEDKKVREDIEAVGKAARACLNTEQFKEYKDRFEKAYMTMVNRMVNYRPDDDRPDSYAFKMVEYSTWVKAMRILLDAVVVDAKKGKG